MVLAESLMETLEDIGRRMRGKPFQLLDPLNVSVCRYHSDDPVECAIQLTMFWMKYRALWYIMKEYLHIHNINKYIDVESISPEMFRELATKLVLFVDKYGLRKYRVGKAGLSFDVYIDDVYIDTVIFDIVLRKNGYPSVFKLYTALKSIIRDKYEDFVIDYEEFCRKAGVEPSKAVLSLKILMYMFPYGGVHYSTSKMPKYRMPPRDIGFDSLFIRPKYIKEFAEYFDELIEKFEGMPSEIKKPRKVVLKPANLLETGRKGYVVEYEGKVVYTAETRKELLEWLRKHGKPEMFVFKIDNCWEVMIE